MKTKASQKISEGAAKDGLEDLASSPIEKLNSEQQAAVTYGEGPLFIVAGAGTGKTRVISRRIAWLIATGRAKAEEILAVTFTEKAAGEMQERLFEFRLPAMPQHIMTFHAFGDSILSEYAYDLGLPPDFTVMGEAEQVIFLEENMFGALPLEQLRQHARPAGHLQALAKIFSRAKGENVSPEEYRKKVDQMEAEVADLPGVAMEDAQFEIARQREIADAYAAYEKLKRERGRIDFADQVYQAVRLLDSQAVVRRRIAERFRYILVDEFQDTNVAQHRLVSLVAGQRGNLTVVGDDDQSIFGFQGASLENLLSFRKAHPGAKLIELTKNYRSTQQILDSSARLISNNTERLAESEGLDKKLKAEGRRPTGPEPAVISVGTADDEAEQVADLIRERHDHPTDPIPYPKMAILVRQKRMVEAFRRALAAKNIPFLAEGSGRLFEQPEVKMAISFLKAVSDPLDSANLRYLAESQAYGFPRVEMFRILKRLNLTHDDLWTELDRLDPKSCPPEARKAAERLRVDLDHFADQARDLDAARLLYSWLLHIGYIADLRSDERAAEADRLGRFFDRLKQFTAAADDPSAESWVKHLDDIIAIEDETVAGEADSDYDAIRIITIHKAKGLEFDTVFVTGCVQERFPSNPRRNALNGDAVLGRPVTESRHLEEERRLCYVAMTRAKRELFFSAASDYGTKRPWSVSQFIREATGTTPSSTPAPPSPMVRIAQAAPPIPLPYNPPTELELSFTSLKAYWECPRKYYCQFVLGLDPPEDFVMQYGSVIHAVIQQLNQAKRHGRKVALKEFLEWYSQRWKRERFLSREHERVAFARGEKTLRRFYAEEQQRMAPTAVEERFSFVLPGCAVAGKYDRIDKLGGQITIVDYKTGDLASQRSADNRVKKDDQLTLYALAHSENTGRMPDAVVFNFVDSGLSALGVRKEWQVDKMRERIIDTAKRIRNGEFAPETNWHECSLFADCPGHKPAHRTQEAWNA